MTELEPDEAELMVHLIKEAVMYASKVRLKSRPMAVIEAEFLAAVRSLPPDVRQRFMDCIKGFDRRPKLSSHEQLRRVGIALGYSRDEIAVLLAPQRRAHLRLVEPTSED